MKDIVIIGASGFGKEVLWLAKRCGRRVLGFLDDTPEKQGSFLLGVPVLGVIKEWERFKECEFVIAIGAPNARKAIHAAMRNVGEASFATLVDPSAVIGDLVNIGCGVLICAGVVCTVDVSIEDFVVINLNSTVGHETIISKYCTLAPGVSVSGNVNIGECSEVGTGAVLREKLNIGAGSFVGMGAVVVKNVDENTMVLGNPARIFRALV